MIRFIYHYRSVTLASVATRAQQQRPPLPKLRFEFTTERVVVILSDELDKIDGTSVHTGLNVTVEIFAASEQEAETKSKAIAENVLLMITYSTLASCGSTELISILCFEKETLFRIRVAPFDRGEYMASQVTISEHELGEVFRAIDANVEPARVVRALSWLRKGINEENFVDEFISYWVGLEVVKSVLRRMLKMKKKDPGEWDGIKDIYENDLHLVGFDEIEEARNKLIHGYEELSDTFIGQIRCYVDPTRRTLIAAVARILGLDPKTRDSIESKSVRRLRKRPWILLRGEVHNLTTSLEEIVASPLSVRGNPETAISTNDIGELEAKVDLGMRFSGPVGVNFAVTEIEHWVDQDSGISKVEQLSLTKVPKVDENK